MVKDLPAMQETQVWSLGQKDPPEKGMATHSSILAWRIPWTEEPGRLIVQRSQRVGHEWASNTFTFFPLPLTLGSWESYLSLVFSSTKLEWKEFQMHWVVLCIKYTWTCGVLAQGMYFRNLTVVCVQNRWGSSLGGDLEANHLATLSNCQWGEIAFPSSITHWFTNLSPSLWVKMSLNCKSHKQRPRNLDNSQRRVLTVWAMAELCDKEFSLQGGQLLVFFFFNSTFYQCKSKIRMLWKTWEVFKCFKLIFQNVFIKIP